MSKPTSSSHYSTAKKLRLSAGKLAASFSTLAVAAAALVALSVSPASAHSHLPASGCVNGTFIATSERSDGLVQDCLTLIAILDHWPGALSVRDWGAYGQNIRFWPGVKVSGGRVTELNLQAKILTGTIPAEIGDLAALTRLNLSHNYLTGPIPEEIGSLAELTTLNLRYNSLSGPIPPEIGQLAELTQLRLNRNNLEGGIIRELGKLAKLSWLDLSSNRLEGSIPSDVVKLARFQGGRLGLFGFCRNHLSGSVPEPLQFGIILIGYPASQGYNPIACQTKPSPITTAPLEVPDPPQTSTVAGCSDGTFVKQPATTAAESHIGLVQDCRALFALKDHCTSRVASKWGTGLIRTINFWDGVTIRDDRVTRLSLRDESLNCTLPEEIGNLTALTSLDLSGSSLYGPIPKEIGNLAQLNTLYLQDNKLSGAIPTEIGELRKLTLLDLSRNDLTGSIPNEVGSLAELINLNLSGNHISGKIPSQIGNLAKLTRLQLGDNSLWGEIPAQMGNMAALAHLSLRSNLLSKSFPAELGDLSELAYLDLSRNSLSGTIPSELGELTELQTLNLYDNLLTGSIPEAVDDLRRPAGFVREGDGKLVSFNYCRNYLSQKNSPSLLECQKIPPSTLGACSVITGAVEDEAIAEEYEDATILLELDCQALFAIERYWFGIPQDRDLLRNADFWSGIAITNGRVTSMRLPAISLTKEIPREISQLTELAALDLSRNELIGPIHAGLANLRKLIWLDLSNNKLTGYIPAELQMLSQLAWLDISDNKIAGRIPTELSNLRKLKTLDLSNNNFWTTIPAVLGNLPELNVLDLSNNNFLSAIPANLGSLNTLVSLDISHNQLTGSIPSELGSLAEEEGGNLKVFSFCGNRLTGAVPEALRPGPAIPETSPITLTDYPADAEYDPIECQIPSTS